MSFQNCWLVILIHEDIYAGEENMGLLLHLRHIADLVVKAAPLSTGLAADVHGQVRFLFGPVHICLNCFIWTGFSMNLHYYSSYFNVWHLFFFLYILMLIFWSHWDVCAAFGGQQGHVQQAKGKRAESLELPFQSKGKWCRLLLSREQTLGSTL